MSKNLGKDKPLKNINPLLILASTSKYRASLLKQLGWEFTCVAPEVDEDQFKNKGFAPEELALKLSQLKALAVFEKNGNAVVVGSDQVCAMGGEIFSKPGSQEAAIKQLSRMAGKAHQLLTAVTVVSARGTKSFTNTTTLFMRPLTLAQIESYILADLPLDCAGSYKLEQQGIKLFTSLEMKDHTAIIGLPLIQLCSTLIDEGFRL